MILINKSDIILARVKLIHKNNTNKKMNLMESVSILINKISKTNDQKNN